MKTNWDYSELATAYLKRPDYSDVAIDQMLHHIGIQPKYATVCDVGAGVAHLTLKLVDRGCHIIAIEPNDVMRALGEKRTAQYPSVKWFEGTGEETRQNPSFFDLVTFGSSFNVTDQNLALKETHRILNTNGWFACMWNYRHLNDPLQAKIENIIKNNIPEYDYGNRREDQTDIINNSGLFNNIKKIEGDIKFYQSIADCIEAWGSHATLQRQAGNKFLKIINEIEKLLQQNGQDPIMVPYTTTIWIAKKINM